MLGIGQGLFFGIVFAVLTATISGEPIASAVPGASIAAVLFGAFMGPLTARMRSRQVAGLPAGATEDQRRLGARAVRGGPVPTDPVVRDVAVHLVRERLAAARRGRTGQLLVFAGFTALYVVLSVTWSGWFVPAVALFGFFLVLSLLEPRRLARRLAVLTGG